MELEVSAAIHEAAVRHLQNPIDFTGGLDPYVFCVAGTAGGYGPYNPVSLFWAWGGGFDCGFRLLLGIEDGDGKGNLLPPTRAIQNAPVSAGGAVFADVESRLSWSFGKSSDRLQRSIMAS